MRFNPSACEESNAEMVALLLNHGAPVNVHCIQGWTPLQEAVCRNNVEICEMLVQAGARLTPANVYGISPLFTAAQSGQVATLRFLIKHGTLKGGGLGLLLHERVVKQWRLARSALFPLKRL